MSGLNEASIQAVAEALADPALDSWVAMQDVGAEVESCLGKSTWEIMDRGAIEVLCWMEDQGWIKVGQYSHPEGLVYWPEQGEGLKNRLLRELTKPGADRESNRMNTMLSLTSPGIEWAKKVTGRSTSNLLRPAD